MKVSTRHSLQGDTFIFSFSIKDYFATIWAMTSITPAAVFSANSGVEASA